MKTLPPPLCDDCGRPSPTRRRVVYEFPDDKLFPHSVFMLCPPCFEIDEREYAASMAGAA